MIVIKLIHDCVRDVMLYLEENQGYNEVIIDTQIPNSKYSLEDIRYTCSKLAEGNYIEINQDITGNIYITEITYKGHMFLDNIRDNKVWTSVKNKISGIASVSLPIIQEIAAQIIISKLGI